MVPARLAAVVATRAYTNATLGARSIRALSWLTSVVVYVLLPLAVLCTYVTLVGGGTGVLEPGFGFVAYALLAPTLAYDDMYDCDWPLSVRFGTLVLCGLEIGPCCVSVLNVFVLGSDVQSPNCTHADWPFDDFDGLVIVGVLLAACTSAAPVHTSAAA